MIGMRVVMEYYIVRFPQKISTFNLYFEILPQINKFINCSIYKSKRLFLDWGIVDIVNPLVIPDLLVMGKWIKKVCGKSAVLYIPTKETLLSYLDNVKFLQYNNDDEIYEVLEEYIGGYLPKKDPNKKTYHIEYNYTEDMIWNVMGTVQDSFSAIYDKWENNNSIIVMNMIWNFCVNSTRHGKTDCYVTFQNLKSIQKFMVSVSDWGTGIYTSMYERACKDEIMNLHFMTPKKLIELKNDKYRELHAIMEAIFYRSDTPDFGIYDAVSETVKRKGIIRISSNDTRVVITDNFYNNFVSILHENKEKYFFEIDKVIKDEKNIFVDEGIYMPGVQCELEIGFQ
jgi:hypothetical protein